jgi:hypothetical protein
MSRVLGPALALLSCSAGATAQDEPSVKVGARLQAWYQAVEDAAPDGAPRATS